MAVFFTGGRVRAIVVARVGLGILRLHGGIAAKFLDFLKRETGFSLFDEASPEDLAVFSGPEVRFA